MHNQVSLANAKINTQLVGLDLIEERNKGLTKDNLHKEESGVDQMQKVETQMRFVQNYLKRLVPSDDSHLTINEGQTMQIISQANVYLNYKVPTAN